MNLQVEHNLTPGDLRKALAGMAIASGIEQEMIETLQKASACDDTPKEPKHLAMRTMFQMMQQEYWQACRDIERYAKSLIETGEIR